MYPAMRARKAIGTATVKNRKNQRLFREQQTKKNLFFSSPSNWKSTWENLLIFPVRNADRGKLTNGNRFQDSMSARRVDVGFWDSPLDQADEQPILCLEKPAADFEASKQIRRNLLKPHALYLD
jgi:hypothetical protein